jgi:L-lysine 2,3-aminomutase
VARIIQPKPTAWQSAEWSRLLSDAVRDVPTLLQQLAIDPSAVACDHTSAFPVRVPQPFIARMEKGNIDDPLLRQVLPLDAERRVIEGYSGDPLAEARATRAPGLIQKYDGRALLIASTACAVHCRYCFRREFPYADHRQDLTFPALEEVRRDSTISEVILSGGDPLMLKDAPLCALVSSVERIAHVKRIRIHTRLPVVIPQRVTPELLTLLAGRRLPTTVVVHVNHARELDADVGYAFELLATTGVTLLNQSVLMAGINDDPDALAALSERLHEQRVLPYYLHMLDPVAGTAHFAVAEPRARALVGEMARRLPGYLVPRLAREAPGRPAKQILTPL